jgi:hypothetical protein
MSYSQSRFLFEGKDPSNHRQSLFLAKYEGKTVLVKFCEWYSETAHRLLASAGLAPALHFCSKIVGGGFMVAMDRVDGRNAYYAFKRRRLPESVLRDVKTRAGEKLHDAPGLVFGNLRRPNIMVVQSRDKGKGELRGLLTDFDWAGSVGKAKYPATLNISDIDWAGGVLVVAPAGPNQKGK